MSTDVVPVRRIREESIVTGEAVELEVRPASPLLRAASGLVDGACALLGYLVALLVAFQAVESPSASTERILFIGSIVLVTVLVPMSVEVATRGRSLGKWAWGLQVVRALAGILELWLSLGSIALVTSMVSPRSKRLGDLAAGTMVVRLPEPAWNAPLLMPPDLAAWASSAQVLPPPDGLRSEALGFLRAAPQMSPAVRSHGASDLASRLALRVAPPPPPGTHPERFIAAVLVILRDREFARCVTREDLAAARRREADRPPFGI